MDSQSWEFAKSELKRAIVKRNRKESVKLRREIVASQARMPYTLTEHDAAHELGISKIVLDNNSDS